MKIEQNRIVYEIEGQKIGEIEFKELDNNTVDIYHTYVDPEYQGKKIASQLQKNYLKN